MSLNYTYPDFLNLYVKGRISREDARRQTLTAKEILKRINDQPGIILADEVGMGKTFVALAVATAVHFQDDKKRPVVVMVPSNLKEKWPRDFKLFRERCIHEDFRTEFRYEKAERAEDFLKLLDDPLEKRKSIIFLTHGAMSRGLTNGWIKLALIQRALYRRRNTGNLKRALIRAMGKLLSWERVERKVPHIWETLLDHRPEKWLKILQKNDIDPEFDDDPETDNDPVPDDIIQVFSKLDTNPIYQAMQQIPYRKSKHYNRNLTHAKKIINEELKKVWHECLLNIKSTLPLLILDEAHHLKNSHTVLASLFENSQAENDAEMLHTDGGALAGMFERMLFLTATPFQLGHQELCNVLERFSGISWNNHHMPTDGLDDYKKQLALIRKKLDESQIHALNLDKAWSNLTTSDLHIDGKSFENIEEWWMEVNQNLDSATSATKNVYSKYQKTKQVIKSTEKILKKWIIRHNKGKHIAKKDIKIPRRKRFVGKDIVDDSEFREAIEGLAVKNDALLPFLLSARLTALTPSNRPVFAEGLSSSYEAFMQTRSMRKLDSSGSLTDFDDEKITTVGISDEAEWYLVELERLLPSKKRKKEIEHPKIDSTVKKVVDLWLKGEKVLVFCHYIATGKALRNYISAAISKIIIKEGSKKLKCGPDQVMDELDKIGKRFLSEETRIRQVVDKELDSMVNKYRSLADPETKEKIIEVIRRYLRTPSFLIRYFPLDEAKMDYETFIKALNTRDSSGLTLKDLIHNFLDFLENRCEKSERKNYIEALAGIQPGGIRGKDIMASFDPEEREGVSEELLIQPNVRLVNGSTKQATRQKLMLTFNTPFYPDILVASSVMAEGVDLHLNCRYIIHHDLCWNPSTLEQRTGRIDRIGAKSEQCLDPIHVYLPFISATQDEKMYRVVMDRERWFKIVMGEKYTIDAKTTEKLAERIPIPDSLAEELSFKLHV